MNLNYGKGSETLAAMSADLFSYLIRKSLPIKNAIFFIDRSIQFFLIDLIIKL